MKGPMAFSISASIPVENWSFTEPKNAKKKDIVLPHVMHSESKIVSRLKKQKYQQTAKGNTKLF